MLVKARAARPATRLTALKGVVQRFSFLFLILVSITLMIFGRIDAIGVESMRARVMDAFEPILDAISTPAATVARFVEIIADVTEVYRQNQELRTENARLQQWKQVVLRLEAENNSLRSLLRFKPDPAASFISARVIAVPGGSFLRSVIVAAGRRDGLRKGQAVIAGSGLVGRVVEVGEWSARILLVTDISARVPVLLEGSRQRAVLAGDNSSQPRLLYLPPDSQVAVGDRVVTSGHGGQFPSGLPVGVVSQVGERQIRVHSLVNLSRIEHVQIVDFGLPGGLVVEDPLGGVMR
ncbi:Cell shape-determining protein MreC [uncultured Gammaproteobacteria bacterium]